MPDVAQANSFLVGIHKQTNEATVGTVAEYAVPVYGAIVTPTFDRRTISVTDASAITPDTYKGPSSWVTSTPIEFVAQKASLGTFLQSMWPTDTASGTAPTRSHIFSGLGTTPPWIALYRRWPNAGNEMDTFGKGHATSISFSSDQDGGPMHVTFGALGEGYVQTETHTVTTTETMANGYFGLQNASSYIKFNLSTPNSPPATALTNARNVTVTLERSASIEPTADSALATNINPGLVTCSFSMEWLWNDWLGWHSTYMGATAGTALSGTTVVGALELFWKHSSDANASFKLYIPAAVFDVSEPTPNPDGSAMTMTVTGTVHKPTSGDHVVPTLINDVTPAY